MIPLDPGMLTTMSRTRARGFSRWCALVFGTHLGFLISVQAFDLDYRRN